MIELLTDPDNPGTPQYNNILQSRRDALIAILGTSPSIVNNLFGKFGLPQTANGLGELARIGERELQRRMGRRGSIGTLGLFLGGCVGLQLMPDGRYYFKDGPNFETHVNNSREAGKDWYTAFDTLITAMAEGKVKFAKFLPNARGYIEIEHFGGRYTQYGQLSELFVDPGDYVGRFTVIGKGGENVPHVSGQMSERHIHTVEFILKNIFNLTDREERHLDFGEGRPLYRLDPEAGNELKLWAGADLFSEALYARARVISYLDSLIVNAPPQVKNYFKKWLATPRVNEDATKVLVMNSYINEGLADWLTPAQRDEVLTRIREYARLRQMLTLPFANPALDKIPGFYQQGSKTRTLEGFAEHYISTMDLLKGRV